MTDHVDVPVVATGDWIDAECADRGCGSDEAAAVCDCERAG